jgi:hypothetical protein
VRVASQKTTSHFQIKDDASFFVGKKSGVSVRSIVTALDFSVGSSGAGLY